MNSVDDGGIRQFAIECERLGCISTRLVYRDSDYAIFAQKSVFIIWYIASESTVWSDASPRNNMNDNNSKDTLPGVSNVSLLERLGSYPTATPWREARIKGSSETYGSVLVFPSGLRCKNGIKAFDILRKGRLSLAFITDDNQVSVFMDMPTNEQVPFVRRMFYVNLHAHVSDLVNPGRISIVSAPNSSQGESVFIFDNGSDVVCEFLFETSVFATPRTCPEWCILHWHLASGLGVTDRSRLTVTIDQEGHRSCAIVGTSSNGDSQGRVELISSRDQFSSSGESCKPIPSIRSCGSYLVVNSVRNFRILGQESLDFPAFIRPQIDFVHSMMLQSHIFVMLGCEQRLTIYRFNPLSSSSRKCLDRVGLPLDGVVGEVAVAVDELSRKLFIGSIMKSCVELWAFDVDIHGQSNIPPTLIDSITLINGPAIAVSVRAPVGAQDSPLIACIDTHHDLQANFPINAKSVYISVALCEEYLILLRSDGIGIEIHSLIPKSRPAVQLIELPEKAARIRCLNWHKTLLILPEGTSLVVVRVFDPFVGIRWTSVSLGASCSQEIFEVGEDWLFGLNVESGQITTRRIPDTLWTLRASARAPSLATHCMLQECLSLSTPNCPEWYKLPGELRERVEGLISPESGDYARNSDFFARKYLISHAFSSLTTQDLAWACLSDFQPLIVSSLIPASLTALTWDSVRSAGVALWLREPALLRDLVDRIQKSALQEYMKSKEPKILDEKLSLWLAALGKQQLIASLYKQHGASCASPAHTKIAGFFGTDFSTEENSAKAIKNAFELVRQKRNGLAVAVFILAGAYQEAVDVCCRQMDDIQLGLAILSLVKLRSVGENCEKLESLALSVWTNKIVCLSLEGGDIWLPLLHAFRTKNLDLAQNMTCEFFKNEIHRTVSSLCGFMSICFDVCYPSVADFVRIFSECMKRLNFQLSSESYRVWETITEQDRLMCLYQTGCSQFAITSPRVHGIHPILKWAIHERLMLSRSDTSTS